MADDEVYLRHAERARLRERLMEYPGMTEDRVEEAIVLYEERVKLKQHLMDERGMSNALAEVYLDRKGTERPPGWHSVFFYPGSMRPRNRTIFWVLIVGIVVVIALT